MGLSPPYDLHPPLTHTLQARAIPPAKAADVPAIVNTGHTLSNHCSPTGNALPLFSPRLTPLVVQHQFVVLSLPRRITQSTPWIRHSTSVLHTVWLPSQLESQPPSKQRDGHFPSHPYCPGTERTKWIEWMNEWVDVSWSIRGPSQRCWQLWLAPWEWPVRGEEAGQPCGHRLGEGEWIRYLRQLFPASYLGVRDACEQLSQEAGVTSRWRAFLHSPLHTA